MDIGLHEILTGIVCALLIGMSKAGLSGLGLLVVPVFASVFGARASTGLLLPVLITADIFAVLYYHRTAEWKYLIRLLPWAVTGILIALWTGNEINENQFRTAIAILVLAGVILMLLPDLRKLISRKEKESLSPVPARWWFSSITGLTGGFATMIGNAAGPVMSLYLLSMRLPKNSYIGTGAWFFLMINLFKVPLHVIYWKTINYETIRFNLLLVIPVLAGVFTGIWIVKKMPEKVFRIFIIVSTLAAVFLLL